MILLLLYECSLSGRDTQTLLAVKKTTENKKPLNSCTHRQWECKTLDMSACTLALAPNKPPGEISTAIYFPFGYTVNVHEILYLTPMKVVTLLSHFRCLRRRGGDHNVGIG